MEDCQEVIGDLAEALDNSSECLKVLFGDKFTNRIVTEFRAMSDRWFENPIFSHMEVCPPLHDRDPTVIRGIFILEPEEDTPHHVATAICIDDASKMLGALLTLLRDKDAGSLQKTHYTREHGDGSTASYTHEFRFNITKADCNLLWGSIQVCLVYVMVGVDVPGVGVDTGRIPPTNVFHVRLPAEERKP